MRSHAAGVTGNRTRIWLREWGWQGWLQRCFHIISRIFDHSINRFLKYDKFSWLSIYKPKISDLERFQIITSNVDKSIEMKRVIEQILGVQHNNDGISGAGLKSINDVFLKTRAIHRLNLKRRTLFRFVFGYLLSISHLPVSLSTFLSIPI